MTMRMLWCSLEAGADTPGAGPTQSDLRAKMLPTATASRSDRPGSNLEFAVVRRITFMLHDAMAGHTTIHYSKPRLVPVVMYVLFLRIGSWACARSIAMLYDCPSIIIVLPCAARPLDPIPITSNGRGEEGRRCVGNHDHTPGPRPWVTCLRVRLAESRCAGRSRSS